MSNREKVRFVFQGVTYFLPPMPFWTDRTLALSDSGVLLKVLNDYENPTMPGLVEIVGQIDMALALSPAVFLMFAEEQQAIVAQAIPGGN